MEVYHACASSSRNRCAADVERWCCQSRRPGSDRGDRGLLLGNAQRCGVASERVLRAGRVIRDMIASLSAEPGEKEIAGARFASTFLSSAHPSTDRELSVPVCNDVVAQFERLERHHRQAGFTD